MALSLWWRRGGYIVLKQSERGWWFHAYWTADFVTFLHFAPQFPRKRWIPPPIFRGAVKQWRRDA